MCWCVCVDDMCVCGWHVLDPAVWVTQCLPIEEYQYSKEDGVSLFCVRCVLLVRAAGTQVVSSNDPTTVPRRQSAAQTGP